MFLLIKKEVFESGETFHPEDIELAFVHDTKKILSKTALLDKTLIN